VMWLESTATAALAKCDVTCNPRVSLEFSRLPCYNKTNTSLATQKQHLKKLGIYSVARRRLRGYLIEMFKILTRREHVNYSKFFELADITSGLRGHWLKLFKPRCHTTVRQNFFSLRIVNEWNKLPQDVVEAPSINTFKNTLDRHWHDMGILS